MTPGEVIDYEITASDITALNASVTPGETVQMLVSEVTTEEDGTESGVYGGYLFLPGGAGVTYLRVDPSAPATAPAETSSAPSMDAIMAEVKSDPGFMEFLEWKANKDAASVPAAPADPSPADPAPVSTVPTFTPPPAPAETDPTVTTGTPTNTESE